MKLRYWLPGTYIVLMILLFLGHAQGAGHGKSLELTEYLMQPACYVLSLLLGGIAPIGNPLLAFLLCVLAGLVQYILLGYLIDIVLNRYRSSRQFHG